MLWGDGLGLLEVPDEAFDCGGVAVDFGTALANRLGVPVEFSEAHNSGELTDALASGEIDVTFLWNLTGFPSVMMKCVFGNCGARSFKDGAIRNPAAITMFEPLRTAVVRFGT